ncbi:MAG TPA: DEAD/DEAH box helicase [Ardenticatenaceae bacterium]|jgi:DEAD/DEAH box helicase domain-containing protein
MSVLRTLERLREQPELERCVTHWERIPARAAAFAPVPVTLDPRLRAALRRRGIEALYTHQAEAVEAAERGEDVVVVTPTASGKTLCYNLPVLDTLLGNPEARALYLFPTKALAQDQRHELHGLIEAVGAPIRAEVYDGDTPASARRAIRASAQVVITNPDMLHTGILPHHTQWLSLWTNLRYIVIDEIHQYRGLFGSHFANLLRRMRRVARFYGCDPQFIAASATIANPGELMERLIDAEEPVTVVDRSGAPQGEKHFVFWNPPPYNEELGLRRSSLLEARRVAANFLADGVQTIVFTRARLTTEVLLRYLQEEGVKMGLREGAVRGYRGGYLPLERREIEQGLRAGAVQGVVSTNALELGIDIGQLDACVLHGYPGTIASVWQQAGRAGRRAGSSAAVLVASSHPLDQFIIRHPEWFFGASPEHARINPDNLLILVNHIRCAAFELPFAPAEGFGTVGSHVVGEVLAFLEAEGVVHSAADTYYWTAESYPAEALSLRTAANDGVLVTEQPGNLVIGEVERFSIHQMCFPGAIYMHEGRQYLIEELDWEESRAYARPVDVDYYTRAQTKSSVALLDTFASDEEAGRHWGEVVVTNVATGYKKIKLHTHENLGTCDLSLPESEMHTTCCWLTFPVEVEEERRDYGPNWRQQRVRARGRDGFRCVHCRISEDELGRELDVHHVIPFREFGFVPGQNDGYLAANELSNLISLCPTCHKRTEPWYKSEVAAGLLGVANAIGNIAPLFLMCDARDLGVTSEVRSPQTGKPTIFLYDTVPSGVGFAEKLWELHGDLIHAAADLIRGCPCEHGCPACVGPEGMVGEQGKAHALELLDEVQKRIADSEELDNL